MNSITAWIKISAVSAVVSAVTLAVVPESKLKNTYRIICTLIVIFSLISAFTSAEIKEINFFERSVQESISYEEKTEEMLIIEGQELLNEVLDKKLSEGGFDVRCESKILIEGEKMKVERISVYGKNSETKKENAVKIIYETIGEECEVIFAENHEE